MAAGQRADAGSADDFATDSNCAAPVVAQRMDRYTQQARFVRGRAFFQNGNQWINADVQQIAKARRVQIQFNSKEYSDLLAKYPHARPWLSIGRNVQLALDDAVYEITE